jgi:hypothetical protein
MEHRNRGPWDQINWMRARLKAFAKGYPGSKEIRRLLETVKTVDELKKIRDSQLSPGA